MPVSRKSRAARSQKRGPGGRFVSSSIPHGGPVYNAPAPYRPLPRPPLYRRTPIISRRVMPVVPSRRVVIRPPTRLNTRFVPSSRISSIQRMPGYVDPYSLSRRKSNRGMISSAPSYSAPVPFSSSMPASTSQAIDRIIDEARVAYTSGDLHDLASDLAHQGDKLARHELEKHGGVLSSAGGYILDQLEAEAKKEGYY